MWNYQRPPPTPHTYDQRPNQHSHTYAFPHSYSGSYPSTTTKAPLRKPLPAPAPLPAKRYPAPRSQTYSHLQPSTLPRTSHSFASARSPTPATRTHAVSQSTTYHSLSPERRSPVAEPTKHSYPSSVTKWPSPHPTSARTPLEELGNPFDDVPNDSAQNGMRNALLVSSARQGSARSHQRQYSSTNSRLESALAPPLNPGLESGPNEPLTPPSHGNSQHRESVKNQQEEQEDEEEEVPLPDFIPNSPRPQFRPRLPIPREREKHNSKPIIQALQGLFPPSPPPRRPSFASADRDPTLHNHDHDSLYFYPDNRNTVNPIDNDKPRHRELTPRKSNLKKSSCSPGPGPTLSSPPPVQPSTQEEEESTILESSIGSLGSAEVFQAYHRTSRWVTQQNTSPTTPRFESEPLTHPSDEKPWGLLILASERDDMELGKKALGIMDSRKFFEGGKGDELRGNAHFWTRLGKLKKEWMVAVLHAALVADDSVEPRMAQGECPLRLRGNWAEVGEKFDPLALDLGEAKVG